MIEKLNMYGKDNPKLLNIVNGREYCEKNKVKFIDFLKIDTEGFEMNVLKGFEEQIKNIKIIQFEYGQIDKDIKMIDIINYLKEYGFEKFSFLDKNSIVTIDNFEEPSFCNIVCFNKLFAYEKLYE